MLNTKNFINKIIALTVIIAVTSQNMFAQVSSTSKAKINSAQAQKLQQKKKLLYQKQKKSENSEQMVTQPIQQQNQKHNLNSSSKNLGTSAGKAPLKRSNPIAASPTTEGKPKAADITVPKFGMGISLSYEQSAEAQDDGTRARGMGLELAPSLGWYNFKLLGIFSYAYDLNDPQNNNGYNDGLISLSYKGWDIGYFTFSPATSVELPLSKSSREIKEIKYINNVSGRISLNSAKLEVPNFSLSYTLTYGRYENKYTTQTSGDPANDYKIVQTVDTGYNLDPVAFNLRLRFINNYSYENVTRTSFLHVESISYTVNDHLGFSLYHYNAAPLLAPTTYENNLKLYDKKSSTVGLSIDLSI
ncbi:MAG: hypothetical protein ACK41T_05320 [Pseudobdellovibrio sp.]